MSDDDRTDAHLYDLETVRMIVAGDCPRGVELEMMPRAVRLYCQRPALHRGMCSRQIEARSLLTGDDVLAYLVWDGDNDDTEVTDG